MIIRKNKNTFGYLLHLLIALDKILNSSPQTLLQFAQKILTDTGYKEVYNRDF